MRKLVVWNLMTLDGYFEGTKPWDIDFHNLAWGPELQRYAEQFGRESDLLVFGRKPGWNNARVVSDPIPELTRLKQEDGKTIFIFGSAELADSLLKAGLIDEVRVCLVPVILGGGNPLFKQAEGQVPLKLIESSTTEGGAVILRYEPVKA
ncbi:dihydrofolate reductase family protein [Rhizobium ruizarguesonis]|uniref:dihydrofolate reductase family protein n=1 Tax=Rhizobium ruizarguesonis TaxID=2081791 RepID=UPI001031E5F2|nr:dihydrofolate reductase family protein [Rhizobium ruizarguesonis]TAV03998.1 dihydrofolate reductase [Rhizobium ruizarguesonis]